VKKPVAVTGSRVPFGTLTRGPAERGLRELFNDTAPVLVGRCDLSLARNIVLWGANPAANARDLWRAIEARRDRVGDEVRVFAIDPGLQQLPAYVRRIGLLPGSDRHLALALMLRIVGNPGHADANRQIPEDARFANADRGFRAFLDPLGANLSDFVDHIRTEAATYLRLDGGATVPDDTLIARCLLPTATPVELARFRADLDALFEAFLAGPTTVLLGTGPGRHLDGEENVQYVAALAFLSGNVGRVGGGVAFAEDRHAAFNPSSFASSHDTIRPGNNPLFGNEEARERINLASLGADAPEATKVLLWFDLDPLTHLPDAAAVEGLLQRTQFNLQVTGALDDSSRFADVILPLGDSLNSYDLQVAGRSPWINLTQPIESRSNNGPRPLPRILHELFAAIRAKLVEEFESDLKPTINENQYRRGPLLLAPTRRTELSAFFTDANRIPDLLRDRLPGDEVANVRTQLRDWYAGVHGG
jgi:anaerobic selenocysteine-containing dehydrogenase